MPVQYEPGTRNATPADIDLTAGIRGGRRGTGRPAVDMYNQKLRAEPWYQAWLASQGFAGRVPNLSDPQRRALTNELRKHGIPVPTGVNVDSAGNLSNPDHFGRNFGIASVAGLVGGIAAPAIIGAIGGGAAAGGGGAAAGSAGAGAGAAGAGAGVGAGAGTAGTVGAGMGGGTGIIGAGMGGAPIVTGAAGLGGGAGAGSAAAAGGGSLLSRINGALDSGAIPDILRLAGGIGAGQGAERNRLNDATADNYRTQQNANLADASLQEGATRDRADRAMDSPQKRAKQILISQMLRNLQPRSISGLPAGVSIPTNAGGSLAALRNSPQALAGLQRLSDTAETAMTSGSDIPKMPGSALIPPPAYQGAGRLESAGSVLGSAGTILEALRRRRAGGG